MSDKSNKKNSKIFNKKNKESGTKIVFTSKTVSVLPGVDLLEYLSHKQDPLKFQRAKESLIAYIGPNYGEMSLSWSKTASSISVPNQPRRRLHY